MGLPEEGWDLFLHNSVLFQLTSDTECHCKRSINIIILTAFEVSIKDDLFWCLKRFFRVQMHKINWKDVIQFWYQMRIPDQFFYCENFLSFIIYRNFNTFTGDVRIIKHAHIRASSKQIYTSLHFLRPNCTTTCL